MCGPEANERNANGLTGVGAVSNYHIRGGKNGDGTKGDPTSYDGFDLVKMGAVKEEPAKKGGKRAAKGPASNGATGGLGRPDGYKNSKHAGLGVASKAKVSGGALLGGSV